MGSETGDYQEIPVHDVHVEAFEMTRTEVTVRQYALCVDAQWCTEPIPGPNSNWGAEGYEDHPVNHVNWSQARVFCQWAGGRLPTEAEWEYAARSEGQDLEYPWGDTAACSYAVMDEGNGDGCGTGHTMAVCSRPVGNTQQGLCDMAGNVWEFVADDWHDDYEGAPQDGSAWVDDPRGPDRVMRGGGYTHTEHYLRTTGRYHNDVSFDGSSLGFRCAR